MNNRIILSAIFVIIANLLAAGSASAQTWTTEAVEINKSESFVSEHCSDPVFTINGRDIRKDINKTINDGSKDSLNPSPCASSINPKSEIQNLSQTTIGDPPLELDKAAFIQKTQKLQIPFIANNGQVDEQVRFYAKTFGGTVFVTKDGEIVYALPKSGDGEDGETHRKAAKCAKERNEKHISHKDTKNTEEMIEGGPWRVQVCNLNPGVYLDNSALFNQWRSQLYKTWGSNCKFEPAMSNTTPIPNDKNETHPPAPLVRGENRHCPP